MKFNLLSLIVILSILLCSCFSNNIENTAKELPLSFFSSDLPNNDKLIDLLKNSKIVKSFSFKQVDDDMVGGLVLKKVLVSIIFDTNNINFDKSKMKDGMSLENILIISFSSMREKNRWDAEVYKSMARIINTNDNTAGKAFATRNDDYLIRCIFNNEQIDIDKVFNISK